MAITSLDGLLAGIQNGERIFYSKANLTTTAGQWASFWTAGGLPGAGAAPGSTSGSAPTAATAGALPFTNAAGSDLQYLAHVSLGSTQTGCLVLYDRLVHTSELNGTVTTAQTVNSAALTRNTSGEGVELWLEQYSNVGTTTRTATVSYTNQAGTSGRTASTASFVGSSNFTTRMIHVPLQTGDTGIQSVQSVTLSGTTGTAGNFGVTLLKRICDFPISALATGIARNAFDLGMPEIPDDACLAVMGIAAGTAIGPITGQLTVAKG